MAEAAWSRHADQDCIRLVGVPDPEIRPASAFPDAPPMAGELVADGTASWFVPRFGFVAGTAYTVTAAGAVAATLVCPKPGRAATTEVAAIQPTAVVVPRNLLRCYVTFTAPMSDGQSAHVRLVDGDGEPLAAALLPVEYELWDADRRRLTVLLDPARIKRGLAAHVDIGYPLRVGERFRLVVAADFLDAQGNPLLASAERAYLVGDDLRGRVDPADWQLTPPTADTTEPLTVTFDRPLDHALLARCLTVKETTGIGEIGRAGLSWRFTPDRPWRQGRHTLLVDSILEDIAGNSVTRVFDRDLADPADRPADDSPVELPFLPG